MKSRHTRPRKRSIHDTLATRRAARRTPKAARQLAQAQHSEAIPVRVFITGDVDPAVCDILTSAGLQVSDFDPETIEQALTKDDMPCAVLWDDPVNCLARAIVDRESVEAALNDYLARAQTLVAALRKNRRTLTFVDTRLLSAEPTDPAWDMFHARLNLSAAALRAPIHVARQKSIPHLLARSAVTEIDGLLGDILEELYASSVTPAMQEVALSDLEAAVADYARLKECEDQTPRLQDQVRLQDQEIARLTEVSARTKETLHALESTHAQAVAAAQSEQAAQARRLEQAQAEAQARDARLAEMTARLEQGQQERDLLQDQVRLQDQEIARLTEVVAAEAEVHRNTARRADKDLSRALGDLRDEAKKRRGLEKQNERLMRRVGDLNSKIDKILVSTSWRLTRPMRVIKMKMVKSDKPIDILIAEERQREQGK